MPYIIVTFGVQAAPGWCDVTPCPMDAYGPFATADEAHELVDRMFAWQQPHVLQLAAPSRAVTVTSSSTTTGSHHG